MQNEVKKTKAAFTPQTPSDTQMVLKKTKLIKFLTSRLEEEGDSTKQMVSKMLKPVRKITKTASSKLRLDLVKGVN